MLSGIISATTLAGEIDVRDHGAAGDGSTDDTAAFVNAMKSGTDIYVPPGTYLVNEILLPDTTNLHGSGAASVILLAKGDGEVRLGTRCRVSNLTFTGQEKSPREGVQPQDKTMLAVRSASGVSIDHVHIEDYRYTAIMTDNATDLSITNCHIQKVNWAMLIQFSKRVRVEGCRVIDTYQHGIQFWGNWKWENKLCEDLTFVGNYTKDTHDTGIWGTGATRVVMANNIVDGAGDVGLDLEWCDDSSITGNTVRNAKNGGISLFFSCHRVSITGNTVINDHEITVDPENPGWWVRSGIFITKTNRGTYPGDYGHRDITVVGNTVVCKEDGPRRAIWFMGEESDNVTIANNTVRGGEVLFGDKAITGNARVTNGKLVLRGN